MTFYLAAKYNKRSQLLPIAALLQLSGHEVSSLWLSGTNEGMTEAEHKEYAKRDIIHIEACTHFVLFNLPIGSAESSSGRNVEFGYAFAFDKRLIVVGEGNCIFYTLAHERYPSIEDFLAVYTSGSNL